MDRQEAIQTIESTFPIDSKYDQINDIGKELLFEAIDASEFDWTELPQDVLISYAEKCLKKQYELDHPRS